MAAIHSYIILGLWTRGSSKSAIMIFGRVLACSVSGVNKVTDDFDAEAPNDTAYTRWSCHSGLPIPVQIVSTPPAPSMETPLPLFGQDGHADPLDGWQCCSLKWAMSRLIQVRLPHANKSGFAISATDKYKLGSRYR